MRGGWFSPTPTHQMDRWIKTSTLKKIALKFDYERNSNSNCLCTSDSTWQLRYQIMSKYLQESKILNADCLVLKNSSRVISQTWRKEEKPFLRKTNCIDLLYHLAKYYQIIANGMKYDECMLALNCCFPMCMFSYDNVYGQSSSL